MEQLSNKMKRLQKPKHWEMDNIYLQVEMHGSYLA